MLAYEDIISTPIETGAICARFSIEQVTLISFMLGLLTPSDWLDYEQYRDEIDALVAATQDAATTPSDECESEGGMIPIGMVAIMATGNLSTGWLECNGNEYAQADYLALFAAIGLNFGIAGAGMFRVPDLRARFPMGWSTDGIEPNRPIGDNVGANTHTLSVAQIPAHTHSKADAGVGSGSFSSVASPYAGSGLPAPGWETGETGGGQAHNNIPSSVTFAYHIYAGV